MSLFVRDLRHSVRQLWRRPVFTSTAVLTLAIGIGVNAVAFTVVNGLLFRGSATAAAPDVGRVLTTPGGDEGGTASLDEYRRFAEASRGTLDLAAEGRLSVAWRHDTTETAWALFVSPNYFSMVEVRPIAGHIHVAPATSGLPSVVVGERFWRRKLNAASLAGLTLRLNNTDVAVAGVLPDSFTGPAGIYSPDVWLPLESLFSLSARGAPPTLAAAGAFNTSPALLKRETRWLFRRSSISRWPSCCGPTAAGSARPSARAPAIARSAPRSSASRQGRTRAASIGSSRHSTSRWAASSSKAN